MIDYGAITKEIADTLGERDPRAVGKIRAIVQALGLERTQQFVEQALEVE